MQLGFLLIFIAVPLAELALLIKLGGWIGLFPTLGVIFLTAVLGTFMLRRQGLQTLYKVTNSINEGKAPIVPMVEGALLLVSGAFLLTPGIITDCVGALLLIPPLRAALASRLLKFATKRGFVHVATGANPAGGERPGAARSPFGPKPGDTDPGPSGPFKRPGPRKPTAEGPVIDGDFERLDEKTVDPDRGRR